MEQQINNEKISKNWKTLQVQLRSQIIYSLQKCHFKSPVPVQQAVIPLMLKNYDLAVQAQTGSGKTLAFVIPLLEKYLNLPLPLPKNIIKFLILSPTRELCQQTNGVIKKLLQNLPDKNRQQQYQSHVKCVTGGNELQYDINQVSEKSIILIGTVGRIKQMLNHFDVNWLKKIDYLYIDEADQVLKQKGINQLIRNIPKLRRTAMFSATLQSLQKKDYQFYGMRNLAKISLKLQNKQINKQNIQQQKKQLYVIPKTLVNSYIVMKNRLQKINFLIFFLNTYLSTSKTIIFFNTCASVQFYTKLLSQYYKKTNPQLTNLITGIHGKLKNTRRSKIISKFLSNSIGCLISTDVISRGLDFNQIHFILQIDPPSHPDNFIHRVGRTARINRPGTAILMIEEHQQSFISYLNNKNVGINYIQNPQHFIPNYNTLYNQQLPTIHKTLKQLITSDRDYIQKSKRAFVSYIRSYLEHDLKYIFQLKNISIGYTAQSFFLLRIPRIKQILGKNIYNFQQSNINPFSIPWRDKNQQLQYLNKKQELDKKKMNKQQQKVSKQNQINIKNNKYKRKLIKKKKLLQEKNNLIKQYRQLKKSKKNQSNPIVYQNDLSNQYQQDQDTQQIQQKLGIKSIWNNQQ